MTPWRRNRRDALQAKKARIQAERELLAARRNTAKVKALAESLIEIQRINHLGLSAAQIIRGEK